MKLDVAAKTDPGLLSDHNEDFYVLCRDIGLYMVADGVGGHKAGELASKVGCELIQRYIHDGLRESPSPGQHDVLLANALDDANHGVYEIGKHDDSKHGLGSTITVLWFHSDRVLFACVGDSRIYLFRNGQLAQLSFDAKAGRYRLAASLGHEETVDPQIGMVYLEAGDRFLLCTDGLYGPVPRDRLLDLLKGEISPARAAARLIESANHRGGPDNITALIADVAEVGPREAWHFTEARHDARSISARVGRFRWSLWAGLAAIALVALLGWAISLGPRGTAPVKPKISPELQVLVREANNQADIGSRAGARKALRDLVEKAIRRAEVIPRETLGLNSPAARLFEQAADDVWDERYTAATTKLVALKGTPAETYATAALAASHDRTRGVRKEFEQGDYRRVAQAFDDLARESDSVLSRAQADLEREKSTLQNAIARLRRRAAEYEPTNLTRRAIERHVASAERFIGHSDLTGAEKAIRKAQAILDGREEPDEPKRERAK